MSLWRLSWACIRHRALANGLLVLLLALGVAMISVMAHVGQEAQSRFSRDAAGIDLVVGAKGSPLQLILSSIYHLDIPTGNIARAEAEKLMKHPQVKFAIPLALGDSYRGFRIVGSDAQYIAYYKADFAAGEMFDAPMQAVVGARVAAETGLSVGSEFAGSHGLVESDDVHEDSPYKVVGVLAETGTVLDRLVITPVESVWQVHAPHEEHEEDEHNHSHGHKHKEKNNEASQEITALLIGFKHKMAAMTLPREINRMTSMQAASPALEVTRLLSLVGIGIDALKWVGGLLMASALIGLLVALYQAIHERRYDMAVVVALGAKRGFLMRQLLLEVALLLLAGIIGGWVLGHGLLVLLPSLNEQLADFSMTPFYLLPFEVAVAGGLLAAGLVMAFLTVQKIARIPVSRLLASG